MCVVKTVVRRTSSSALSNEDAVFDELADALQRDEGRVAFVQVPHRRLESERANAPARRRRRG